MSFRKYGYLLNVVLLVVGMVESALAGSLTTSTSATCVATPFDIFGPPIRQQGGGSISSCSGSVNSYQGSGTDSSNQFAAYRSLGSEAEAQFSRTADSANLHGSASSGYASFTNVLIVNPKQHGALVNLMGFNWSVSGNVSMNGLAGATIASGFTATGPGGQESCTLGAAGDCAVVIPFEAGNSVTIIGEISTEADAPGTKDSTASAKADFIHTAELASVFFLDANGQFIDGITVTDDSGNVIPVVSEVPEPLPVILIGGGLLLTRLKLLFSYRARGTGISARETEVS